jgi:hypothetical protein
VTEAKRRTLASIDTSRLPPAERAPVAQAVQKASVDAFHLGMGLSAALVALGGVLGLVGIVNPRRKVRSEDCAGGQLVAAPLDAARLPERDAPAAALAAGDCGLRL